MLLLLVCLGLRCQSREQKEWHGCRATKVRRTSRSRHFVCFYLVPASVVEPVSISTGSGSCGRLRKKMYKQIKIKIQFWKIKKIVLLLLKQCCGAATFLGGSGSGRPRSRSRLRLQAKKAALAPDKKGRLLAAPAPAPDTNFFNFSSEKCNYKSIIFWSY